MQLASTSRPRTAPARILLVEDDPADVELTREALADGPIASELDVVDDGREAISFLHRDGEYARAPHPDLVLLDLNLPRMSGFEVLAAIRSDPRLRLVPVVVLSTSGDAQNIRDAYAAGANAYIQKPIGFSEFSRAMGALEEFWLSTVKLPER